jgi:hypothetical protein
MQAMQSQAREWIPHALFEVDTVKFELRDTKATLTIQQFSVSVELGSSALGMLETCYEILYFTCSVVQWTHEISTIYQLVKEFETKNRFVEHIESTDYLMHMFVFIDSIKIWMPTRNRIELYAKGMGIEAILKDFRQKFEYWSPSEAAAVARFKRMYLNLNL